MRALRVAVAVVPSLCIWLVATAPARAADDAIVEFGKFPCRFNGRLTTIEDAARNVLLRISGRDHYFDDDGAKHSAAEWLLGEAVEWKKTPGPPVFRIENAELLKLTKLEARAEPGPQQHRYSFVELRPAFPDLQRAAEQSKQQPPTEFSAALIRLMEALMTNVYVSVSFLPPAGTEPEQLRQAMEDAEKLRLASLPLIVPPKEKVDAAWTTWSFAALTKTAIEALQSTEIKPYAATPYLSAVFEARRADDRDAFAKAVAAYAGFLKDQPPRASALSYTLPAGWMELGVPTANPTSFYGDTNTDGAPVANFRTSRPDDDCLPNLIYFPGRTATVEQIVNDWRINSGLAPLADKELQRLLTPVSVGSLEGTAVDITANPRLPDTPSRQRAVVFRRNDDALVFMATGSPEAVEAERVACDALLASLRLGSPEEARAWFDVGLPETPRDLGGVAIFVVVVPRGADTWYFQLNGVGPASQAEREAYLHFVEQFPGDKFLKGGDPASWTPPTGWRPTGESVPLVRFVFGEGERARYLTALPLAGYTADSETPLVNDGRVMLNLPLWTAAEAAANVQSIKIGDADARAVELIAPAASK